MTAVARVVKPGPQTTVQDAGRFGRRHLGVPQSGAADRISFALANAAAGNPWNTPGLECLLTGPELEFTAPCVFALGGADMRALLNNTPAAPHEQCAAKPGDRLSFEGALAGARGYIAISGGVAGEDFLGSCSTYLPGAFGGIEGRTLREGDILNTTGDIGAPQEIPLYLRPALGHDWFLRATTGPEAGLFNAKTLRRFVTESFTADRRGDRMGLRLTGENIHPENPPVMNSSPVFPGTVQCPPDGAPFLLLPDAQTVGGYARIAQVIDADLSLTGQIRPGDRVWFKEVNADEARDIALQKAAFYSSVLRDFRFN